MYKLALLLMLTGSLTMVGMNPQDEVPTTPTTNPAAQASAIAQMLLARTFGRSISNTGNLPIHLQEAANYYNHGKKS